MARGERKLETIALHVRVPVALCKQIDAEAAQLGVRRTAYVRGMLAQALGEPARLAVLREAFYLLGPVIRRAAAIASQEAFKRLPQLIEAQMHGELEDIDLDRLVPPIPGDPTEVDESEAAE